MTVLTSCCEITVNLARSLLDLKFLDSFSNKNPLDMKFYEKPSIGSPVILFGQTDKSDMMKLIFAFPNFFFRTHLYRRCCLLKLTQVTNI